jgi:hypothetical protein
MDSHQDISSTSLKSKYVRIQDQEPSQIDPIPYYPNLHRQLHSFTASIILAYLEIHHPAPQDYPAAPVTVDPDIVSHNLQVGRRTLLTAFSVIGTWWKTEELRARGARANREFLNPLHSFHGTTKPYSITGSKSWESRITWVIRRNRPYLDFLLYRFHALQPPQETTTMARGGVQAHSLLGLGAEVLKGSVILSHDGRTTKAERLLRKNSK